MIELRIFITKPGLYCTKQMHRLIYYMTPPPPTLKVLELIVWEKKWSDRLKPYIGLTAPASWLQACIPGRKGANVYINSLGAYTRDFGYKHFLHCVSAISGMMKM